MVENDAINSARQVGGIYITAIEQFIENLDDNFASAVDMLLGAKNHVVLCGMGKSGLFGRKISATFASTGTPSIFLHPAEALHGDLGKLRRGDVVVLISSSGETEEIIRIIPALKRLDASIIAMTGNPLSSLGKHAHITLDIAAHREACPLNLAPTTSGLLTLVMGDALAIALMERRDFKPEDFAATHPGGALGRRLLDNVADHMTTHKLPFVASDDAMKDVIITMTEGRLGLALVGGADNLEGVITDGDLRRALLSDSDIMTKPAAEVMSKGALTIKPETNMGRAEEKMQENRVQCLVVVDDEERVVGVVQIF